jgi:MFS family permease
MISLKNNIITLEYYFYTIFIQMRFTKIIAILFLINNLDFTLIQYTVLQSSFSIAQFAMELPSGILSDYFSNKTIVILGAVLTIVSQLIICLGFAVEINNMYELVLFAYILEGIGRAFISGSDDAFFYKKLKENNLEKLYGKIIGKVHLVCAIAIGAATFLGGIMYSYKPQIPYIGQMIFTFMAVLIVFFIKDEKYSFSKMDKHKECRTLKKMFNEFKIVSKNKESTFMVLFISFVFAVIPTIFSIMPNYLDKLGFNAGENGMLFMILSFIGGIISIQAYRLERLSFGYLILITCTMMSGSLIFILFGINKIVIFIGLVLLYVILDLLEPVAMKSFNSYVGDDIRATFLSMVSFITTATTMIVYPIVGYIVEKYGMNYLLVFTVLVTMLLLVIAFALYKSFKRKESLKKYSIN